MGDFRFPCGAATRAVAIRAAVERARRRSSAGAGVLFGCVLQAGVGQAPARQASLGAGFLVGRCTTIHKVCGSAMKATMLAQRPAARRSNDIIVAAVWNRMSSAPICCRRRAPATAGSRRADRPYVLRRTGGATRRTRRRPPLMGTFAEDCAAVKASRARSRTISPSLHSNGPERNSDGSFAWEIAPVTWPKERRTGGGQGQQPFAANLDKIPTLKPAFRKDGTSPPQTPVPSPTAPRRWC